MKSKSTSTGNRLWKPVVALLGVSALVLTASCAQAAPVANGKDGKNFTFLTFNENTQVSDTLKTLSLTSCKSQNRALPLKINSQPQASYDQQIQLLAGQKALPSIFFLDQPALAKKLNKAGYIVDLGKALTAVKVPDAILGAAASAVRATYAANIALPVELNIEGIWYNKKILSDNGITPPSTWTDFVAASAKLKAAGIQAISAAGKDGWPVSRLVGNYIFRLLGPDAMSKIADHSAKLTDPKYLEGAQAVANLGAGGYFGDSVGSIDYSTAMNTFLTGKAAFFYMGSWALGNFNDPTQDKIGADNIGFIGFPTVSGGVGSQDQLGANVGGTPIAFASKSFGPRTEAWLKCIATNYGYTALSAKSQTLTGMKVSKPVKVSALTQMVIDKAKATKISLLWFEALFPAGATEATTNAGLLASGGMSPADYMSAAQAKLN